MIGKAKSLVAATLALMVTGTVAAWALWPVAGEEDSRYRTAVVDRGRLTQMVTASGTVAAEALVQVGSSISGRIIAIAADFNSEVREGQVIARLDSAVQEARVAEAEADLAVARAAVITAEAQVMRAASDLETLRASSGVNRATLERARVTAVDLEREFNRREELVQRGAATTADRDRARAQRDAARASLAAEQAQELAQAAQVRSGEAQVRIIEGQLQNARAVVQQRDAVLRRARIDLDYTIIRAPVDGTVISRNIDVGQTVAASLQAPVLFTIARDLKAMQVETAVDEADVGRLRLGQPVTFTVEAFAGEVFRGRITQIRKAPTTVQTVVTYVVVIAFANPEGRLIPGMTATARVVIAQREDVLRVPNAALRFRPPDAPAAPRNTRVFVLDSSGQPRAVTIRTGITDGSSTEVLEGSLAAGDRVITGQRARAGQGPRGPMGTGL
ncbi:MAG: efflux RND transporter periplasmic adaptor subunit [Alphaproteobacteria bacterium]|nr:efflux RND transporter periplasmic adaptor subunit [Alphaproteobacteria bacterium]TAD89230.1 MAG: efflux RND transporter periplasmic adaptor subunit [Alphaproteobacteria bacterium]